MVKNYPSKRQKEKIYDQKFNFGVIYQPLYLKIYDKVAIISPKTMLPKQL